MSAANRPPKLLITPVQWFVAALGLLVVAGLVLVTWRPSAKIERADRFFPPGATVIASAGPVLVLSANSSITNVKGWYAGQLGVGLGGSGASFQYRSSAVTPFSRRYQRIGSNHAGSPADAQSSTFMVNREGRFHLLHVTQQADENNCTIYVMQAESGEARQSITPPIPPFPRNSGTSVSSSGDMNFQKLTARTNLTGVIEWYAKQIGLPTNETATAITSTSKSWRLPTISGRTHPEAFFVRIRGKVVSFIHAVDKGSNTTEVIVSSASL